MLPHVSSIKNRWLRRGYILLGFGPELIWALGYTVYGMVCGSIHWWRQP